MNAVIKEPENQIVEFDEFELKLNEFKEKYDDVVYDLTVPEQEKQARADKHSIGKVLSKLDSAHKALKAPLKARTDLIDGRRKEIKDQLISVQGKIKEQIDVHEQAKEEHAGMLQNKVDYIRIMLEFTNGMETPASKIAERLEQVKEFNIDDSYEDRKADATLAQIETLKELETMLADRIKYESEQAELEKLRKEKEERERADREEEIRKGAEDKAKREAEELAKIAKKEEAAREAQSARRAQDEIDDARRKQEEAETAKIRAEEENKQAEEDAANEESEKIKREQAENERQEKVKREAEEKAEREKRETAKKAQQEIDDAKKKLEEAGAAAKQAEKDAAEAVEKAKREEREKIEREQAEKERQEKAAREKEEAKKSKQAHRDKIKSEAIASLIDNECSDQMAHLIVEIIDEGGIKHVSLNY